MKDGIRNAIIEAASINDGERGFLNVDLMLDYGGTGQGFGGFLLYMPKGDWAHHTMAVNYAGHFIWRCMAVAGVSRWDHMKGQTIRARIVDHRIQAIGHIVKDDWFDPAKDFDEARASVGAKP